MDAAGQNGYGGRKTGTGTNSRTGFPASTGQDKKGGISSYICQIFVTYCGEVTVALVNRSCAMAVPPFSYILTTIWW